MTEPHIQTLLREGIAAAKAAQQEQTSPAETPPKRIRRIGAAKTDQRAQARQLLLQVIELDETNLQAWLWLSTVMDDWADKRVCLENVLALDPNNKPAQSGLAWLDRQTPQTKIEPAPNQRSVTPGSPPSSQGQVTARSYKRLAPKSEYATTPTSSSRPPGGSMACPFCQGAISSVEATCRHCQLPLIMNCPACGEAVDIEQRNCPQCDQVMGNYRQRLAYFTGLAAAYQKRQQYQEVLKCWQAVGVLKPDYPQLQIHLGEAYLGLGRPDKATNLFQQALEEDAGSAQAHFALGELLRQRGEIQEAFSYLHQVTQLDPEHGLAWLRLGQVYERARQFREAIQAYRRATKLLPAGSAEADQARRQLERLQPPLPEAMATGWTELLRQMTGPVTVCLLAALLDAGLRPWWIPLTGWFALLLASGGAFLWASATTLPRNPLLCLFLGDQGLPASVPRFPLALAGILGWVLALGIILLPLGQSWPEGPG